MSEMGEPTQLITIPWLEGLREAIDDLIVACDNDSGLLGLALQDLLEDVIDPELRGQEAVDAVRDQAAWALDTATSAQWVNDADRLEWLRRRRDRRIKQTGER